MLMLMGSATLQTSEKKPDASILSAQQENQSAAIFRIWEASKSSSRYQEEQMRKIREKMEQEKSESSPK